MTPIFAEAIARAQSQELIPTTLGSSELEALGAQFRQRSLILARVTNAGFLAETDRVVQQIVEGKLTEEKARRELEAAIVRLEIGDKGLSTDGRLRLIIRMQSEMAFGFGQWQQGQNKAVLKVYPAQEFYRAADRKEPLDWPTRWTDAGGEFYGRGGDYPEGRMIALKGTPIWEALSAFGTPYPPFDYNSGMDVRDIERAEAVELGVMHEDDVVAPETRDFLDDLGLSEPDLDDDLREELLSELGNDFEFVDGVLQRANESPSEIIHGLRLSLFIERMAVAL